MKHCATDSMMSAKVTDYLSLLSAVPNAVPTVCSLEAALRLLEEYGRIAVKEASFEHKARRGKVFLNLTKRKAVETAWKQLKHPVAQPMVDGYEFIVSKFHDKVFGDLIMLGSGSFLAEALKDKVIFKLPISRREARIMIENVFLSQFVSKRLLVDYLLKFAEVPFEVEVNPLIVSDRVYAVDVRPV